MEDLEEKVDYTVTEVINKFKSTLDQEVSVISDKDNDWSLKQQLSDKKNYYELEFLIVSNILLSAKDLHAALNGKVRSEAPIGFKWLDKLLSAFDLHNKRVDSFLKKESKLSSKINAEDIDSFKSNIEFRNKVKDNQAKFKRLIKGISTGDETLPEVPIRTHKKTEFIPLSCRFIVETKYPEIKDYLLKRKDLEDKLKNRLKEDEEDSI